VSNSQAGFNTQKGIETISRLRLPGIFLSERKRENKTGPGFKVEENLFQPPMGEKLHYDSVRPEPTVLTPGKNRARKKRNWDDRPAKKPGIKTPMGRKGELRRPGGTRERGMGKKLLSRKKKSCEPSIKEAELRLWRGGTLERRPARYPTTFRERGSKRGALRLTDKVRRGREYPLKGVINSHKKEEEKQKQEMGQADTLQHANERTKRTRTTQTWV